MIHKHLLSSDCVYSQRSVCCLLCNDCCVSLLSGDCRFCLCRDSAVYPCCRSLLSIPAVYLCCLATAETLLSISLSISAVYPCCLSISAVYLCFLATGETLLSISAVCLCCLSVQSISAVYPCCLSVQSSDCLCCLLSAVQRLSSSCVYLRLSGFVTCKRPIKFAVLE